MQEFKNCSVKDCLKNASRLVGGRAGMCCTHYQRIKRYGSDQCKNTGRGEPWDYLLSLQLSYSDDCIKWPYTTNVYGYGVVRKGGKGKTVLAHREVCRINHGEPASEKLHAAHLCGKGHDGCVNPGHLAWATAKENCSHKLEHGTDFRGEKSSSHKLKWEDVARVRCLISEGRSMYSIAKEYGVTPMTISHIKNGRTWKS